MRYIATAPPDQRKHERTFTSALSIVPGLQGLHTRSFVTPAEEGLRRATLGPGAFLLVYISIREHKNTI